jgi:hypothetical protein
MGRGGEGGFVEYERSAGGGLTEAWGSFCGKWMEGAGAPPIILGGLRNVGKNVQKRFWTRWRVAPRVRGHTLNNEKQFVS